LPPAAAGGPPRPRRRVQGCRRPHRGPHRGPPDPARPVSAASPARRYPSPGALLLAPGAGSDRNHPTSLAIEAAVAPPPVGRLDCPCRQAGRRAPDRQPVLVAAVRAEAAALAAAAGARPARLALGGRSMGGRMCSIAVAEGLPASRLVLL